MQLRRPWFATCAGAAVGWTSGLMLLVATGLAAAAGLGAGDAGATLGQPLNFAVTVRLDAGETLTPECVAADVTVGDRRLPPPLVRTAIEMTSPQTARVRVMTQLVIDEPVVAVLVSVGCANRISRSFVVLADPPGLAAAPLAPPAPAASALPPVPEPSPPATAPTPPPAARATVAPGPAPSTAPAPAVQAPRALTAQQLRAREERRARLRAERQARQAARKATLAAKAADNRVAARAAPAPRLQLDIVDAAARSSPTATESEAVSKAMAAVAEAASAAQQAALAASASALRVAALEQELAALRQESKAGRDLVGSLRQRVVDAEAAGRWTTPLVWGSVLLACLAAWLAWRLGRVQALQREPWQQEAAALSAASGSPNADEPAEMPAVREPTAPAPFMHHEGRSTIITGSPQGHGAVPQTVALPRTAARARAHPAWPPPAPPVAWPPPASTLPPELPAETLPGLGPDMESAAASTPRSDFRPDPDTAAEPPMQRTEALPSGGRHSETMPRDVSIEELIDLEQQAEFFMVLGQEDAAVDLLVEHLRSTGGGSPLPYLKLLEIHRRRGDHEAYERMRQRFNHRFNAYAPEWGVDLTSGRSLEDYAGVVPRLQQVWPRPLDAMAELEALLFRKSRGELFDLPAYREVLFLYSLARDLLDRAAVDTGSVDLLLPMSDGTDAGSTAPAPLFGLERDAFKDTMPPEDMQPTAPLDFDLNGNDRPTSIFDLLDDKPRSPRRH